MSKEDGRHCESCGKTKPVSAFGGKELKCKECTESWVVFRRGIDEILNEDRPSRASISEREWRERAYAWARNHMPNETTLVRHIAQREVDSREKTATRKGNAYLRRWIKGMIPLFWNDLGHYPIAVTDPGGEKLHIRLDAATIVDARRFAHEERDRSKRDYDERLLLCKAIEELADRAAEAGYMTLAQLGDQPPFGMDEFALLV
jgi:hypothetical protein